MHRSGRVRVANIALALAVAAALTGCRLELAAEAALALDGTGTADVSATFDQELLDIFDELELDPTAGLEAAAAAGEGWQVDRAADEGGLTVSLAKQVDTPGQLGAAFAELSSGLSDDDPAFHLDVEVALAEDGTATIAGTGSVRPPTSIGVLFDDEPLGPDADELEELVETHVAATFSATLPGDIGEHDADSVDGQTATWDLPVGQDRQINAQARQPQWWQDPTVQWAAGGAAAALLLVLAWLTWWWRRRRDRRRAATTGR